ncbi:cytochrome P450 [Mycobacteroides stephanolepidis]|uniref:Cytochrome P450 n=1 Tax=[Mycobacterium] stephanolepidis TaxID=1520670 RepID=A0A1Z4EWF2_9MYCO|nr:cytochrome P450 [[Mycobacterium] stephanolepidis]
MVVNERLNTWMLGRYQDVHAAARQDKILSSAHGIFLRATPISTMITTDSPDHERLRRITQSAFSKKAVGSLTDQIRTLAEAGVDQLKRNEIVDLVPALTIPLPISVIAHILGVPREQWRAFRAISDRFAEVFSPRTVVEVAKMFGSATAAFVRYRSFVTAELRRRAGCPGGEALDELSAAVCAGEITEAEAFFYSVLLLVAGNETTSNLLGMLLMQLAKDPELFDELRADRSLVVAAVDETARWGSPVQWVTRVATAPYPVGGTVIPQGGRVVMFWASANRDPRKFDQPDRFDIHRSTTGQLGFGHGIHHCLGAHLARIETVTAVNHVLDRVDGLELAGPVRWGTTPSLQGPASLPVRIRRTA